MCYSLVIKGIFQYHYLYLETPSIVLNNSFSCLHTHDCYHKHDVGLLFSQT